MRKHSIEKPLCGLGIDLLVSIHGDLDLIQMGLERERERERKRERERLIYSHPDICLTL